MLKTTYRQLEQALLAAQRAQEPIAQLQHVAHFCELLCATIVQTQLEEATAVEDLLNYWRQQSLRSPLLLCVEAGPLALLRAVGLHCIGDTHDLHPVCRQVLDRAAALQQALEHRCDLLGTRIQRLLASQRFVKDEPYSSLPVVRNCIRALEEYLLMDQKTDGEEIEVVSRASQLLVAYRERDMIDIATPTILYDAGIQPPSTLRQHWLPCTLLIVGGIFGLRWMNRAMPTRQQMRNSTIGCLDEMRKGFRGFADEHVFAPLKAIWAELFHQGSASFDDATNLKRLQETTEALRGMLLDFARDSCPDIGVEQREHLANKLDMSVVNHAYREEIKRPLVNAVRGELPRMMLIKVQSLEQELIVEKQQIDTLMRRNQFNLQVLATLPAFLVGYTALCLLGKASSVVQAGFSSATARLSGRGGVLRAGEQLKSQVRHLAVQLDHAAALEAPGSALSPRVIGRLLLCVHQLKEVSERTGKRLLGRQGARWLQEDLQELLCASGNISQMRQTVGRMYLTHKFLRSEAQGGLLAVM